MKIFKVALLLGMSLSLSTFALAQGALPPEGPPADPKPVKVWQQAQGVTAVLSPLTRFKSDGPTLMYSAGYSYFGKEPTRPTQVIVTFKRRYAGTEWDKIKNMEFAWKQDKDDKRENLPIYGYKKQAIQQVLALSWFEETFNVVLPTPTFEAMTGADEFTTTIGETQTTFKEGYLTPLRELSNSIPR